MKDKNIYLTIMDFSSTILENWLYYPIFMRVFCIKHFSHTVAI